MKTNKTMLLTAAGALALLCASCNKNNPEEPAEKLFYHVDKSSRRVGWSTAKGLWDNWETTNAINCNGKHPCYYIVPSNAQDNLNYSNDGFNVNSGVAFPYRNINTYVPVSWNGVEGVVRFSDISYKNNTVTLRAYVPTGDVDYVTIADPGSYRAGDRFTFDLVCPEAVEAPKSVAWYYDDPWGDF